MTHSIEREISGFWTVYWWKFWVKKKKPVVIQVRDIAEVFNVSSFSIQVKLSNFDVVDIYDAIVKTYILLIIQCIQSIYALKACRGNSNLKPNRVAAFAYTTLSIHEATALCMQWSETFTISLDSELMSATCAIKSTKHFLVCYMVCFHYQVDISTTW